MEHFLQKKSTYLKTVMGKILLLIGLLTMMAGGSFAQSDDFEAATLDTNKWKVRNNSHQGFIITGPSPSGSRHLRINSAGNSSHSNHMYQQFAAKTPSYISWSVRADTIQDNGPAGYFVVGDSSLSTNSNSCVIFSYISANSVGVKTYNIANGTGFMYTMPYIPGSWYKVECKNINFGTKRFELWINDTLRNDTFRFRSTALTYVSYTRIYNLQPGSASKFDNIVIWSTPTLTTATPASITSNSVLLGGNVLDSGQTATSERGIVYATTPNPTTANTKVQIGNGLGAFSQTISSLSFNTKYYVRAYAINGVGTGYGTMDSFTTANSTTPTIVVTGTLGAFKSCQGSPSAVDSFIVSGSSLTDGITVNAPPGFEITSIPAFGFTNSFILGQSQGTAEPTTVYVRMKSNASGSPFGAVSLTSSGAANKNLVALGTVYPNPTATVGAIGTVLPNATSFNLPYSTLGAPNQYSIVTDTPTAMPSFVAVSNATLASSPIVVSIPMSSPGIYNFKLTVKNTISGCSSTEKPFALTVGNPEPILTVSGTPAALSACVGSPSTVDSFTVSGNYLTAGITINAPSGFEISTSVASGYGNNLSFTQVSGSVAPTRVYVRLSSSATGTNTGNIVVFSSGDNSAVVAVSGTVNPNPSIALGTIASVLPTATSFNLVYTGTTGSPNQYSLSTGAPTAMSGFVAVNNATLGSSPIAVNIPASAAGNFNFNLSVKNTTTGCTSNSIPFVLSVVNPSPTVSISGSFDPITACSGSASGAQQFKVNGIFLTGNVNVSAPAGFEIATTLTGAYGATIALKAVSGVLADTPLYVRMSSTASGTPSGNITCSSAGATDKTLAIIGTVTPNPAKPVISVQAADPICKGAEYLNFGAASEAPVGVIYQWSATNALLYAQGSTKQYALASFPNSGDATITLKATGNGCSSEENITYSVSADQAQTATVRYFNKNFVCEANQVSKYQWGFDDLPTLKGNVLTGEINQNYFNATPDLANKSYWAVSTKGNCFQKTYYNKPSSVASVIVNKAQLSVYPNPFSSEITLSANFNLKDASITLLDAQGKLIQTFTANTSETTLQLGNLASGIYFIQVMGINGEFSHSKVIKH